MIFEIWMPKTGGNLIQFLIGLDVVANTQVAQVALKHFFDKIPDMLEGSFTEQFMESMTAEMAFILRVYCEHKIASSRSESAISDILPELSVMNGYLRAKYDSIVTCNDDVARAELEFVLNELIKVCSLLDFSDEVGRRAVFDTVQEVMQNLEICDAVFEQCIQLLTKNSSGMSELLSMMTGFLAGFRDIYETTGNQKAQNTEDEDGLLDSYITDDVRIMANLKGLQIIQSLLSTSGVSFAKYPLLVTFLDEIVIPSVNSQFAAVQAAGLKCLGLCCTIEKVIIIKREEIYHFCRVWQPSICLCFVIFIVWDMKMVVSVPCKSFSIFSSCTGRITFAPMIKNHWIL